MDIIAKAFELAANNKEFGALVGILIYSMKTHSAQKVQQATCNGRFDKQDLINTTTEKKTVESNQKADSAVKTAEKAEETAEKAEETAEKAFECVRQINKKVDGLVKTVDEAKKDYKRYIDDKHTESLTKPEK